MSDHNTTIEGIIKGIQASTYEIETEIRLAGVGLKDEQDIDGVLAKYSWLYNLDTIKRVRQAYESESDPVAAERLRRVYYYVLDDGFLESQTAALVDKVITSEMNSTVEVDGETIPFHNVRRMIAAEPNFERRNRLQGAALEVTAQTNPDRREIIRTELAALADEFGYYSYTTYMSDKKRVDYDALVSQLDRFLSRTEDTYRRVMGRWVQDTVGRELGEIGSHHFAFISRLPQYDQYFPKDKLVDVYDRTLKGLGLDLKAQTNIHLDTEDRPKKNPRAFCSVPNPPSEVHLVIKPQGGLDDYSSFFHEAGHAQHYDNEDPSMDYINRAIGSSYALTEIFSFLMQFLTLNEAWLRNVVGLSADIAREVANYLKLTEFFMVRRYVAKLRYELAFYEQPLEDDRNQQLYSRELSEATGFVYQPVSYLSDMDAGYYSADYLRAWITESMLRHHLVSSYGESWFGNPKAGNFLKQLWALGESQENEDVARSVGCEPFDTTYLAEQFLALGEKSGSV